MKINENKIKKILNNKKIRQAVAFESPFWFALLYLRDHFHYSFAPFHLEMFELIHQQEHDFIAMMAFRESGKSTIMNMTNALWSILGKPQKKFVIIISKTQEQAKNHFANIKSELKNNPLLKEDFGPFIESKEEWNKMSLDLIYHGSRIMSATGDQPLRGLKHNQYRPDLIICDDLEDTTAKTDRNESKVIYERFKNEIIPTGSDKTRIIVLGNLIHEESFLMRIKEDIESGTTKGIFRVYPLFDNNGKNLWQEKFCDHRIIEELRKKISPDVWTKEYLLKFYGVNEKDESPHHLSDGKENSEVKQTPLIKPMKRFIITAPAVPDLSWGKDCLLWIAQNKIKTEKGREMEFDNHRFLKDIYNDLAPVQAVRKASQVGFSTMMILKSLWLAKHRNFNIIYTLPTFSDVKQFVPSKVNTLIGTNPILGEWVKDKDTVFQKQVGKGFIYYRGTFSKGEAGKEMESGVGIMFSSDINIHDECDRSDQAILEQYESRLEASDFKGKWYFSNPSTPYTLGQKIYEQSDQKHWFIKCSHCKEWQYLDYWKNIIDGKFVCRHCNKEITDEDRRNGQWVKKYANKNISGYWIPHLICPWISAAKIEEAEKTKTKQYFYNFVLGLPYIGSEITVNRDIILQNIDNTKPNFQENNVLGVDSGIKKHWVLGNKQGIFRVGQTDDWAEIENLINLYDVEIAVFDALPDLTEPRKLRDKYPGKVWLCYYKKEIKRADFISWDYKSHTVFSDRTKIIQQVIDEMVNRKIRFQIKPEELEEYIRQWQNLYKITEKDSLGIERDAWETTGDDHFVHATNYFRIALEKGGEKEGTIIMEWKKEAPVDPNQMPDIKKMAEESTKGYYSE